MANPGLNMAHGRLGFAIGRLVAALGGATSLNLYVAIG